MPSRSCRTDAGSLQRREERWAFVDLIGIPTVPVPNWVKETLDAWLRKTVWHVVKKTAASMNIPRLAPHDLRRSCARLCHDSGGELEQIHFLLGHVSVQTTERYIGLQAALENGG
jgi:integrase